MLQKTTDEALRVEDDLAEAIDLIWMLDAAVRGFEFDPDTPNGRSAAGMASTLSWWSKSSRGVGKAAIYSPGSKKSRRGTIVVPWPSIAGRFVLMPSDGFSFQARS